MRLRTHVAAAALLVAELAVPARSEIYRWVDAQGVVHYTQDLAQVPAHARAQAERSARPQSAPKPTAQVGANVALTATRPRRRSGSFHIPFEKRGQAMLVYVRLNDGVTAPFVVDTGASDVVVPAHVAQAAGIHVAPDAPREVYQTANGLIESAIVTLDSVEAGDARVERVRGSISDSMSVGLLGGTFFNNFTFQIDPAANVITLIPNANVRAGANPEEWRARFRGLRRDLAKLDHHLSTGILTNDRRAAELAERRERLVAEIAALEEEADAAGVPHAWRE
jgi:clan AA aspartic protease (TIGR02281 family)